MSTYFHVELEEGRKVAMDVEAMELAQKNECYLEAMEKADLTGQSSLAVVCHPLHLVMLLYLHVH